MIVAILVSLGSTSVFAQECTQDQARKIADDFIISYVGESYFNEHYVFSKIESPGGTDYAVYYQIKFDNEVASYEPRIVLKNCVVEAANAVLEPLEITVERSGAIQIAQENGIDAEVVGFSLIQDKIQDNIIYLKPYWQITMNLQNPELCKTIIIDAVTGDYTIEDPCSLAPGTGIKVNYFTTEVILFYCGIIAFIIILIYLFFKKKK